MIDRPLTRSQPMDAFAETFGAPDGHTTSRMRKRVRGFMKGREARRQRYRHYLHAALITAAVAICAALAWWWWLSNPTPQTSHSAPAVFATEDVPQTLELASGGHLELGPQTELTLPRPHAAVPQVRLTSGRVDVHASPPLHVVVGPYRVESQSPRFTVRRTEGVPRVTAHEGAVVVFGPDLPRDGVRITASR